MSNYIILQGAELFEIGPGQTFLKLGGNFSLKCHFQFLWVGDELVWCINSKGVRLWPAANATDPDENMKSLGEKCQVHAKMGRGSLNDRGTSLGKGM
jgi:hypothetical protein